MNLSGGDRFFRREPSEVGKNKRVIFIGSKTDDSKIKGKLVLYCQLMEVSKQGFYDHLHTKERPYKYA